MAQAPAFHASPHFLQLYTGDDPPPISPLQPPPAVATTLTLPDIWERHVSADMIEPAKKTVKGFETVLSHWKKLAGNPPVSAIDRELLREFQRKLLAGKHSRTGHRSAATVNKLLRTLRPLVVRCWPRDSHNPDGLGLCDYFKFPPALKWQKRIPRVLTNEEITALFEACDSIQWKPEGPAIDVPAMVRAAMVCHFNCGPRTFDLLDWRWESIDWTFAKSGCVATVEFVAKKTGKHQRLPLNSTTAAALRKIMPAQGTTPATGPVWPCFPRSNATQVRRVWSQVRTKAGVLCVMEDFRKTCNTRHEANRRGMGPWVLGHSAAGVNATNYYDPTHDVLEAMATLPQPGCFVDWVR